MDYRSYFLIFAVLLYGGLGSPTPERFGVIEAAIGVLLLLSVRWSGLVRLFPIFGFSVPMWRHAGALLLIYGVSVSLLYGIVAGNEIGAVLRDFAAFLFLLLPLFVVPFPAGDSASEVLSADHDKLAIALVGAFIVVGICFSLRVYYGSDPLAYLGNMPSVLFTAIFLVTMGLSLLVKERLGSSVVILACGLICIGGICAWPIMQAQQRAGLGAIVLALFISGVILFVQRPVRFLGVALIMGALFWFLAWEQAQAVYNSLAHKTAMVGANMRSEEWAAVWSAVSENPFGILFGLGWGASFHSPAVADIRVYYTHSLFSAMLLKTGLIGFLLCALYIGSLARIIMKFSMQAPELCLALAAPLLIDVFLYASYKSLGFGILLAVIAGLPYLRASFQARKFFRGADVDRSLKVSVR